MIKYLSILALGLCACGGAATANTHAVALTPVEVTPAHQLAVVSESDTPVDLELSRGRHAQALRCSDNLSCLEKMSGLCTNGYSNGEFLTDGSKIVGILFHCITNEEKATMEKQEAEEKAQEAEFRAARAARIAAEQQAAEEAQKKAPKKK